jgi:small-conductance mechanosensitive channel
MRLLIAVLTVLLLGVGAAHAADAPAQLGVGWLEHALAQIETEASGDVAAVPEVPEALSREWRSFDAAGSSIGALVDFVWVALAAIVALAAQRGTARLASRRARRRAEAREGGPNLADLLGLLVCDIAGLVVFMLVFGLERRHWLAAVGVTPQLATFAANVLMRWRVAIVVIDAVLRPHVPVARLVDLTDQEAVRLSRFLSTAIIAIILLVGFGRMAIDDADSSAPHVIGLINALIVCGLYLAIVYRARAATENLIRGRRPSGVIAAVRAGLARAWFTTAIVIVAGLLVFFVAGLSLGLLSYYHAVVTTLGILFVAMIGDRLLERGWHDSEMPAGGLSVRQLQARTFHRIICAIGGAIAAMALAAVWTDALELSQAASDQALRSAGAAIGTLFVAYVVWELVRLEIDRHLQDAVGGPAMPGAGDDDEELSPASRLQTILPLLRAAFAVVITVLTALIVLSRLGVDTAPLIAGAGVFGLAVSFGSQSLVRDIISGLFYMWDDAFRVGEYIDTGRLKGTVETLGIRSVKLRHQNGPLHTIPYGQLGAVSNLSRDFATMKFNLRFEPDTDIELVRKTTKQLGLTMQEDNPELASEIILPLKLQGLAEIVDNAVVLRFKFTSRPIKPSWVQREYLKRLVQVFGEKDIRFASGATMVLQTVPALPPGAPPDPADTAAATVVGIAAASEAAAIAESVAAGDG